MKGKLAYKLFRVREDGSIGSLFCNRSRRLKVGKWMQAEAHLTKGLAFRPGWHCCSTPNAPHLKTELKSGEKRVWLPVEIKKFKEHKRPETQGGLWYTAKWIKIHRNT